MKTERYWSQIALFLAAHVFDDTIEVGPRFLQDYINSRKLEFPAAVQHLLLDDRFDRFGTTPACKDGRTDRQTDTAPQHMPCYAQATSCRAVKTLTRTKRKKISNKLKIGERRVKKKRRNTTTKTSFR